MHCPNCGKQNADQTKYCRACGDDLEIVSQVIKGRLPVLIASKVDQLLDSRSERFRRDSLLAAVMSLTVLSGGLVSWLNGYAAGFSDPTSFLLVPLLCALLSLLEYAAYRRTLSPDFSWTRLDQDDNGFTSPSVISLGLSRSATSHKASTEEGAPPSVSSEVARTSVSESPNRQLNTSSPHFKKKPQIIYCPRCGKPAGQDPNRCGVCGANLEVIAKALAPRQETWLTATLDSYIRWRDKNLYKTNQMFVFTVFASCLWVALGISKIAERESGWWVDLFMAVILLGTGAWDRVTYRRNSGNNEPRAPKPLSALTNVSIIEAQRNDRLDRVEFVSAPTEGELKERTSVTESTTRRLENDPGSRTDPLRKHAVASNED